MRMTQCLKRLRVLWCSEHVRRAARQQLNGAGTCSELNYAHALHKLIFNPPVAKGAAAAV